MLGTNHQIRRTNQYYGLSQRRIHQRQETHKPHFAEPHQGRIYVHVLRDRHIAWCQVLCPTSHPFSSSTCGRHATKLTPGQYNVSIKLAGINSDSPALDLGPDRLTITLNRNGATCIDRHHHHHPHAPSSFPIPPQQLSWITLCIYVFVSLEMEAKT